jgi:hypothetical protein
MTSQKEAMCGSSRREGALQESRAMKVRELMERLEEMSPEAEVHIMYQRNYPLQSTLLGICESADLLEDEDDERAGSDVVFLVEGDHVGYGLKSAWRAAS